MSDLGTTNSGLRSRLDIASLVDAIEAEAAYRRIWMPPEPWWDALLANKDSYAATLKRRLDRGARWPQSEVVSVRKPGHGIRPVAIMCPDVRVIYRAITSALIAPDQRADRSASRFAEFIVEPIRAAYGHQSGLHLFRDASYSHILATDIAAFYQYIDHAILRDELDLAGFDLDLIDGLVTLLDQIEGRSFGIPQRSEPSDWISEFYAARLERWLVRDGFDVWRYSDDFRVGCMIRPGFDGCSSGWFSQAACA